MLMVERNVIRKISKICVERPRESLVDVKASIYLVRKGAAKPTLSVSSLSLFDTGVDASRLLLSSGDDRTLESRGA